MVDLRTRRSATSRNTQETYVPFDNEYEADALGIPAHDNDPTPKNKSSPSKEEKGETPNTGMQASKKPRQVSFPGRQVLPQPPVLRYRIGRVVGGVMVCVALFFDLLPLLIMLAMLALFGAGIAEVTNSCGSVLDFASNLLTCTGLIGGLIAGGVGAFYVLPALPGAAALISLVAGVAAAAVFGLWFFLLRASPFSSAKKVASIIINMIGETVSFGLLPSITIAVLFNVIFTRMEDRVRYYEALEEYEKKKKEYTKKYAKAAKQTQAASVSQAMAA